MSDSTSVTVCTYFDRNLFVNLNSGRDDDAYYHFRLCTEAEAAALLARWRAAGTPDLLLSLPELSGIYGESLSLDDYTPVLLCKARFLWKSYSAPYYVPVLCRTERLEALGLKPLDAAEMGRLRSLRGEWDIPLTEEMREAVRNGADPQEVLAPYLDRIFGEP